MAALLRYSLVGFTNPERREVQFIYLLMMNSLRPSDVRIVAFLIAYSTWASNVGIRKGVAGLHLRFYIEERDYGQLCLLVYLSVSFRSGKGRTPFKTKKSSKE